LVRRSRCIRGLLRTQPREDGRPTKPQTHGEPQDGNRIIVPLPRANASQVVNRRRPAFEQFGEFSDAQNVILGWCCRQNFCVPAWDTVTTKDAGRVTPVVGLMVLL
jgi:hypothetical protein